jgi:hypothetical protein
MGGDKDWSPENEIDPLELQRQQLELGKKFMAKVEAKEKEEQERRERLAEAPPLGALGPAVVCVKPPSFEEVSAALTKCWEMTKKAVPDAPDHVKIIAFQSLLRTEHPYVPW